MHTLEQLERGELAGTTRLDLCADLDELPDAVFGLADTLEVLNLTGNRLSSLPADLSRLHKLRILFCSENRFTRLPDVLGDCPQLEMVGFKANRIRQVDATALPAPLRWLILTDNAIEALPEALGERPRLQKLMLAGNALTGLPASLADAQQLELLRIAANRLERLPGWLADMPRLAWLAFAGNPFSDAAEARVLAEHPLPLIDRRQIDVGPVLGQGASGIIHRANWRRPDAPTRLMAVKLFKGEVTSDGLPHSEMAACIAAGRHPHLIGVAGPLAEQPQARPGLLMELVDPAFQPLAAPPSLASCTRDVYAEDSCFSAEQTRRIATAAASVARHLHALGILHGDLYAHNLLVDPAAQCLLSDFGAASFFTLGSTQGLALQRLEARAFGCLLEELLQRTTSPPQSLTALAAACQDGTPVTRPDFNEILAVLERA
ncbi:leucine-rich repeat-containing protein kinase family protein [Stutzerimonas tarimensis]|uniref:Leucine-rich repeat-containing protein kinase family protein n=1 Tax=Stutzerimonas tarimensis TaxID=1507735 RepID=A0ABV7T348_9GAMM